MSILSLVLSRPGAARYFMAHAPEAVHERTGRALARRALRNALGRTRAYPAYLREHGIDPNRAASMPFEQLPLMSRADYVDRFPLEDLVRDGTMTTGYTIEKSSGYSGETHYWFRTAEEDSLFPDYMEFAFAEFLREFEGPTLAIVGMALGAWPGGEKVAQGARTVASRGRLPMSVISPGNDLEAILDAVTELSPRYTQTFLFAYPPFAKVVIEEGIARGIDWQALNTRVSVGGEGFSEAWRRHMTELIGRDPERHLLAVIGGYGATDLGLSIGREFPLSILVRQLATEDASLARDLFGSEEIPNLFQYNSSSCHIEECDGELVFTVDSGIPLVRYRIRDRGGVLSHGRVMEILRDHAYDPYARLMGLGYDREAIWTLPFFHCLGRSDGAVLIGGLNVYPENLHAAVDSLGDSDIVGFKLGSTPSPDGLGNRLLVMLEHRLETLQETERRWLSEKYTPRLMEALAVVNREYRDLLRASRDLATPVVVVFPCAGGPFVDEGSRIKRRYSAEASAEAWG